MDLEKQNFVERYLPSVKRAGAVVLGIALLPFSTELAQDVIAWADEHPVPQA